MISKFIKNYKKLFWFFVFFLITAILINSPLSNIPEKFEYGSELGKFLYDISIGYLVSYFFFYLVVFLKEEKDTKHINYRVSLKSTFVIIDCYSLFDDIFHNTPNSKNKFPPTFEEVKNACLHIDPFKSPVIQTGYNDQITTTWEWLLRKHREENLKLIEQITSLPYIDSELLGLYIQIEDSQLYFEITNRVFPQHKVDHFKDGSFMDKALFDYFIIIQKLEGYVNEHFGEFTNHTNLLNERKKLYLGKYKPRSKP